jgi:hypothetical protein
MIPSHLLQPSIAIGDLIINEPVTMLSDFLISLVCLLCFFKIKSHHFQGRNNIPVLSFFFFMFFSTFWGGLLGHGLQHYLSPLWKIPSWLAGMLAVVAFQLIASNQIKVQKSLLFFRFLLFLNLISFLVALYLVFILKVFVWVQFHAVFGILGIVLPIQFYFFWKTKSSSSGKILLGISFTVAAALIHLLFLGFGKWFNHADISHVLLAFSNWFFYSGLKSMLLADADLSKGKFRYGNFEK